MNGVIRLVGVEDGYPRSIMSSTITDGRTAAPDLLPGPPRVGPASVPHAPAPAAPPSVTPLLRTPREAR